MAKFWPLHHYNQCMGENRRKTLSTAHIYMPHTYESTACRPTYASGVVIYIHIYIYNIYILLYDHTGSVGGQAGCQLVSVGLA